MKKIVFKPKLEEGDEVIFNEEICIVKNSVLGTKFIFNKKTNRLETIYDSDVHDIIESPESESQLQYALRRIEEMEKKFSFIKEAIAKTQVIILESAKESKERWETLKSAKPIESPDEPTKPYYIDSGICPLCKNKLNVNTADEGTNSWGNCTNCSFDPNKITDNELRDIKEQVADAGKAFNCSNNPECDGLCCQKTEEKPRLKLRVGGVYKRRDKTEIKIVVKLLNIPNEKFINHPYADEKGYTYHETGKYGLIGNHPYDLIEEVQPEKVNSAEWCECPIATMIDRDLFGVVTCVECRRKVRKKSTVAEKVQPEQEKKPEGNPFKVGDEVSCFTCILPELFDFVEVIYTGFIEKIKGNLIEVKIFNELGTRVFHYKQCERVE